MFCYKFNELLGNNATLQILKRSLALGTFSKFTIFGGTLGCGKSTVARIAAMSLTCKNPKDGQPCLECEICKSNMEAFASNGTSMNVKVVNMGQLISKMDVKELIKDVFILQSIGNTVYVLEEAHALSEIGGAGVAFLEEIDRMQANTYIIMCTTKANRLLPELRSRATLFNFKRLNNLESEILLKNYSSNYYHVELPQTFSKLLIQYGKGIPRNLLNSLEFVIENHVTENELKEFIQVIDDEILINLFLSMKDLTFFSVVESLFNSYDSPQIISALKSFIIRCIYLIEANINDNFTKNESADILAAFNAKKLAKIVTIIENLKESMLDEDVMFALFRCRLIVTDRNLTDVVSEKKKVATKAKLNAERLTSESVKAASFQEIHLKKLSGGDNH